MIAGIVDGDSFKLSGVYVRNVSTKVFTLTSQKGRFMLPVNIGDTLRFVYLGMKDKVHVLTADEYDKKYIQISMEVATEELSDVVVEKQVIDEVTLGIVSEKRVHLTKNERQLKASEFRPIQLLGLLVGGMPLDPVINAISGRTKKLKKMVALDKDKINVEELYNRFYSYSVMTLKVPESQVKQFMYYIVDYKKDEELLSMDEELSEFYLTEIYQEFKNQD
ncbi:hypothetical protein NBRC110019_11440 [Neptunitalea chrysea]|uniref:Carboxypeptidase-like regulatory domain-containing protein n=1 Tax=Neptunitalea chrysea TaxID=1647581 RepID=A0A9W6B432_9FLAO|nr:hypothetical protein [Neptunitalea chrysea]GLB52105.1 hypothetical protein NBRC110019_11440 [Neptunitalea chrysea]